MAARASLVQCWPIATFVKVHQTYISASLPMRKTRLPHLEMQRLPSGPLLVLPLIHSWNLLERERHSRSLLQFFKFLAQHDHLHQGSLGTREMSEEPSQLCPVKGDCRKGLPPRLRTSFLKPPSFPSAENSNMCSL